jgi:hypothetical protein
MHSGGGGAEDRVLKETDGCAPYIGTGAWACIYIYGVWTQHNRRYIYDGYD